jgi:hypothetical protein
MAKPGIEGTKLDCGWPGGTISAFCVVENPVLGFWTLKVSPHAPPGVRESPIQVFVTLNRRMTPV